MDSSEMQLSVLKKLDPSIQKYLFVSTFCSIFENDEATSQWMPMDYEGSLYIVETQINNKPLSSGKKYKLVLLNRKLKKDFIESFDDRTEFKQNQQYVFYKNNISAESEEDAKESQDFKNSLLPSSLRVIYFSQVDEKEKFWTIINEQVIPDLKQMREKREKEKILQQQQQLQQQQEKFFTREQVKETLVSIVSGDKFVDMFYQMLVKKYGDPKSE